MIHDRTKIRVQSFAYVNREHAFRPRNHTVGR